MLRIKRRSSKSLDCKTVLIFEYPSTDEQSNRRSGTRPKTTESETGERRFFSSRASRTWDSNLVPRAFPSKMGGAIFWGKSPGDEVGETQYATLHKFLYWFLRKNRLFCSLLKALQSLLDLLPCSNVIGYVCTNECMVKKGTSSKKIYK